MSEIFGRIYDEHAVRLGYRPAFSVTHGGGPIIAHYANLFDARFDLDEVAIIEKPLSEVAGTISDTNLLEAIQVAIAIHRGGITPCW